MNKSQKKSGSPILAFFAVFAVIVIITLVTNRRSHIAAQLSFPLNNGISALSTCGNLLSAVSSDNHLYIWEWADLSKKPREYSIDSEQSSLISPDTVISMVRTNPGYVIVSGIIDNTKHINIPLPFKAEEGWLGVNRDKSKIFLLLSRGNNQSNALVKYNLFELLIDSQQLRPIVDFDSEQSKLGGISIADNGQYVVGVGDKKSIGWMFVIDTKKGRLEWQKEFPDFKKIFKAAFSTNGEVIYARGPDSTLLVIKTSSGDITDRLLPIKENKSTYKTQPVQTVAVSGDGNIVAATILGTIYVWDTRTNKMLYQTQTGHKVLSSINFSGDSRFLATSDMRQGGKIIIFKMPQTNK